MVEVFKIKTSMEGEAFYIKPIPFKWNGELTYNPLQGILFMLKPDRSPSYRYISYMIINGELKLHIYGENIKSKLVPELFRPITKNNLLKVNVKVTAGFLNLTDTNVVDLNDCDIDYKDKYIINNDEQYTKLIKNTEIGQVYQVIMDECNLILSYSKDNLIIDRTNFLLSNMVLKLRKSKLLRLKEKICLI